MSTQDTLVRELIRFGEDQLKVLGKRSGGLYVARCLELWRDRYGDVVVKMVREKLIEGWRSA